MKVALTLIEPLNELRCRFMVCQFRRWIPAHLHRDDRLDGSLPEPTKDIFRKICFIAEKEVNANVFSASSTSDSIAAAPKGISIIEHMLELGSARSPFLGI